MGTARQPPASSPGSCEDGDTHLEQVDPRLDLAVSPRAGTLHIALLIPRHLRPFVPPGAGVVGGKQQLLPCVLQLHGHTLGAGSCAERREGENLGVSHNAPLQTA